MKEWREEDVVACYLSHSGKVRANNEDSLLVGNHLVSGETDSGTKCLRGLGGSRLIAVADGMGGHRKGEVASRTVLDVLRERSEGGKAFGDIAEVIGLAKGELNRIVEGDPQSYGLGTTVSGIAVLDQKILVFNCGDSRVYGITGKIAERLTRDDSLVQQLADEGVISEEEMRTHPHKNIVTSAVLGDLKLEKPKVTVTELSPGPGMRFLVCTDGVWESLTADEMNTCCAHEDPREILGCLRAKILESGARDNFTMIAVVIG